MDRIIEPILMEDDQQCCSFTSASFSRDLARMMFIDRLLNRIPVSGLVADLGCGPGDYGINICKTVPVNMIGFDGSSAMIKLAENLIKEEKLESRFQVRKQLFEDISQQNFDVTISSLTLHHQHDPNKFWNIIKNITKNKGYVFVTDFIRPNSINDADNIVKTFAENEDLQFQIDYKNSLLAAFTIKEIKEQLNQEELSLTVEEHGQLFIAYGQISK